ncbi:uncharacterized protein LOC125478720 [Pyrus x bretschneideri]|uniref:uncharacterized protein LOC125478720 n=1 Tax=Pyrus x bretschneideri TaxID=225117 RepID=UPI00202F69F3|nr:uncharacterized protein LOC125478720 [Pyrus x bretschneideri]
MYEPDKEKTALLIKRGTYSYKVMPLGLKNVGAIYQRSYTGLYLRCLAPPDDLKVLSSIHEGVCGNHSRGLSLMQNALNASYYWPTMHQDAKEFVQKCDRCQHYKPILALPASKLHLQTSHWPFMQWAI